MATSPTVLPPPSNRKLPPLQLAEAVAHVSDSQPIDYSQGRSIPIPEDAPTKIFFFIEDLFFIAKIQETSRKLGVKVAFVKNDKDAIAQLTKTTEEDRPGLIVFDLNNTNAKPLTLIPKLKAKLKRGTSIVGFLSHLQGDLKAKAVEAGCDTVMPRAAFSQNLPNLLRRYGTVEEDEQQLQPVSSTGSTRSSGTAKGPGISVVPFNCGCALARSQAITLTRKSPTLNLPVFLSRRPSHRPATQQMQMQVVDRLSPILSRIDDHTISLVQLLHASQLCGGGQQVARAAVCAPPAPLPARQHVPWE